MPGPRRNLPSLGALATFEAAARLGSFTLAAGELGVTQAAVSRQIKQLEGDLGVALFLRAHRRVTLTEAGTALAAAVSASFSRMAEAVDTLRQPQRAASVTVGATLAFSHFWLLPRLPAFRRAHPTVNLRLIAQDPPFDLRHDRIDVLLHYGTPPFTRAQSLATLQEEVFPVCSSGFRDRHGAVEGEALLNLPLIGLDWTLPNWLRWPDWARQAGLARAPAAPSLSFNHYTDAIHAAMEGEGVALGWAAVLSDLLADGRLVRLGPQSVTPPEQHHLLLPEGRAPSAATQAFVDWLAQRFAKGDA
jgi:DNA-binding transcriptional LysR family regulator